MTVETTRKQITTASAAMAASVAEAGAATTDGGRFARGADARDYVMRLVAANPLPAVLVAGAIAFAIASRIGRR